MCHYEFDGEEESLAEEEAEHHAGVGPGHGGGELRPGV